MKSYHFHINALEMRTIPTVVVVKAPDSNNETRLCFPDKGTVCGDLILNHNNHLNVMSIKISLESELVLPVGNKRSLYFLPELCQRKLGKTESQLN